MPTLHDNDEERIKHALEQMAELTEAQNARVRRALDEEELAGGPLNSGLSTEIRRTHRMRVDQIAMVRKIRPYAPSVASPKKDGPVTQLLMSLFPKAKRTKLRPISGPEKIPT